MVRQETIEISEQRTAFVWFFAQEVDWCMINCDKQRLQTSVSINLWKILAGHTGDWFDVKTASICTTELWDALKSFILTSLKFKVAAYPIIVSLDTLSRCRRRCWYQKLKIDILGLRFRFYLTGSQTVTAPLLKIVVVASQFHAHTIFEILSQENAGR